MQTAAAPAPVLVPSSVTSLSYTSERTPPYWDDEREEWMGNPTGEEKFTALKAAVGEEFKSIDE